MKIIAGILGLLMVSAFTAGAALLGVHVDDMKKDAGEVLGVQVVSVKNGKNTDGHMPVKLEARITKVKRSGSGVKEGERICIQSYRILSEDFTGPLPPPEIKKGWKGTVYLKSAESAGKIKQFGLAAYGHSFEGK